MNKPKGFTLIFIPSVTVFISSFCIMVLELVAGRLIARHLGSSLYTWTAVIGVILGGITIGNYLGGRAADRFSARKTISLLFWACSASCIVTIILNNTVGQWSWLWSLGGCGQVFFHVALVFLLPSIFLGMISPVVAKTALESGLARGRTIGDIYAWGAAGSIAGTFAAGYWLIAAMGAETVIWAVGAVLLLMGILYYKRFWFLYIWAVIFAGLMVIAFLPGERSQKTAVSIGIKAKPFSDIVYADDTQYCYVAVYKDPLDANRRYFHQDKLKHSEILMDDEINLQYDYTQIYAAITEGLSEDKEKLNVMAIGGGGYVFPRYVEKVRPGSRIDVVEIDAGVTKAVMEAFGLSKETTINSIHMDGRNYVDQLLKQKQDGKKIVQYDFIYLDALNDYSVPFQLVTKEFNEKIFNILSDDGVYLVNLIDIFDSGLFLGSVINTLEQRFGHVYVVAHEKESYSFRSTFVIAAAKKELNLRELISKYKRQSLEPWYLNNSDINTLKEKAGHLVLTDDYSPVENLLAPVVRNSARETAIRQLLERALELREEKKYSKSIETHLSAIAIASEISSQSYNEIGIIYAMSGELNQAIEAFEKSIQCNDKSEYKSNMTLTYYNLGLALKKLGKYIEAREYFHKAVQESHRILEKDPNDAESWRRLGKTFEQMEDYNTAIESYKKAIELNPYKPVYYEILRDMLEERKRYDEAIEILKKHIELLNYYERRQEAIELIKRLRYLEYRHSHPEEFN
ncbi:MAG: fused MFS/spermidine synthase [Sedimentisphaerales bacterium]|nr:fused MFS/spermidine synthase [Sedimentisphaerales bacterium]